MKYTTEVIVDLPRKKVVELFDSTENLFKWQPTLVDFEHLEGNPGTKGAKSKLSYDERGRTMEMIETIIEMNLPNEMISVYESKGVYNYNVSKFVEEGSEKTRWIMETEFKFSGFMKLFGFFMRGAFPKETLSSMNKFKEFAEKETKK